MPVAAEQGLPGTLTSQSVAPRATAVQLPSLQTCRVRKAMRQDELASASGVSLRTVSRLETGGRAGMDTVKRLATALGVNPADLQRQPPEV
jgi:DNA-binding Xre family transcriptional regulator